MYRTDELCRYALVHQEHPGLMHFSTRPKTEKAWPQVVWVPCKLTTTALLLLRGSGQETGCLVPL